MRIHKKTSPHKRPPTWAPAVIAAAGTVAAVGAWYFLVQPAPQPAPQTTPQQHAAAAKIDELNRQPIPASPAGRATYFAELGQWYEQIGDSTRALDAYLRAQQAVDENGLSPQVVYYEAIADTYLHQGNKPQAKAYLQRYRTYLQERLRLDPDDPTAASALAHAEARLREF